MKVVHALTRLLRAGAEENTIATCLFQARSGWDVTLAHGQEFDSRCLDELKDMVTVKKVDSLVHPIHPVRDLHAIRDLRALYRDVRPDIIHTHQSKAGIVGRLAAAAIPGVAVVHTVHIAPFVNVRGAARVFYVGAERMCAQLSDAIISVSHGMREAYLKHGIGPADLHHVVHSGMPLEKFTRGAAVEDWRTRIGGWSGPGRPHFVLMMAAFEPRKRQREFLDALAPYLNRRDDVCVLFAGDGPERSACQQRSVELGIAGKVRFLGFDPDPQELIALADICALTSEREGLPRAVVQYLAGDRPVVVTALPGLDELVRDGVNGVVVPSGEITRAASEIFSLLSDPERYSALAAGAHTTDLSPWRLEHMGLAIEKAYVSALAHARTRRPWGRGDREAVRTRMATGLARVRKRGRHL